MRNHTMCKSAAFECAEEYQGFKELLEADF